jgi:two-component system nitrate/nitrite response regulator NarP
MAPRILLADDHPIVRQGLNALLGKEAWTVVAEASNGEEAVALAQQHRPEIAVLDLNMPGLNGVDAAKVIRRVSAKTKCIMLSVHSDFGACEKLPTSARIECSTGCAGT